jgi:hypothetical protein
MRFHIFLFYLTVFLFQTAYAQSQFVEAIKATDSIAVGGSIIQTLDSGFILIGSVGYPQGNFNPYILRLDKNRDTLWSQIFTGVDGSWSSVIETSDSGFITCGSRIGAGGKFDGVILKLKHNGTLEWIKDYGTVQRDWFNSIQPYNNGFIISGSTEDTSGNIISVYLIHVNNSGNIIWSRIYKISTWDTATSVLCTRDNNILVAGFAAYGQGSIDILIMKIDPTGNVIWAKIYGTLYEDRLRNIIETPDGGFLITGADGNLSTNFDMFALKIDSVGTMLWSYNYDFTFRDFGGSCASTTDGNFVIGGYIVYPSYDIDAVVFKIDTTGNILWSKVYGDTNSQIILSVQQLFDGGLLITGQNQWSNYDLGILITKTNSMGEAGCNESNIVCTRSILTMVDGNVIPSVASGCIAQSLFYSKAHNGFVESFCNTTYLPENIFPENRINVYPNPASDHFTLDINNAQGVLKIFNANGKLILEKAISNQVINIQNFENGFYTIRLESHGKNYYSKLIIGQRD